MTDSSAPPSSRPRPAILAALAVALVGLVAYNLWPAARQAAAPSNVPREQRKQASAAGSADVPGSLQVQLDELKQSPPAPDDETTRNPFRFYVKPPPPPPPTPVVKAPVVTPGPPPPPPGPPPLPPIPLKAIGWVEKSGKKWAIFQTEKPGIPMYATEGELVLGQYRVVKIGVESVTMEYWDGRGRQTIPMR